MPVSISDSLSVLPSLFLRPASSLAFALYDEVLLFTAMGVGTFILELGAPIALLHKRLVLLWAVNTFLMHWGIFFIMGITFRYQLSGVIFTPFFNLERVWRFRRAARVKDCDEHKSTYLWTTVKE